MEKQLIDQDLNEAFCFTSAEQGSFKAQKWIKSNNSDKKSFTINDVYLEAVDKKANTFTDLKKICLKYNLTCEKINAMECTKSIRLVRSVLVLATLSDS
jgi:hypothetical protein